VFNIKKRKHFKQMWLVRNKDIACYDKHRVTDNAVIQLTHGFSFPDQR